MPKTRVLSVLLLFAFAVVLHPVLPNNEVAASIPAVQQPKVERFVLKPARRNYADLGDYVWQHHPAALLDAIRAAEGVPSYGNVRLARRYGGHTRVPAHIARAKTQELVRSHYNDWASRGKNGRFLIYLRNRYAPIGAKNDPGHLNDHWIGNVVKAIPKSIIIEAQRKGLK